MVIGLDVAGSDPRRPLPRPCLWSRKVNPEGAGTFRGRPLPHWLSVIAGVRGLAAWSLPGSWIRLVPRRFLHFAVAGSVLLAGELRATQQESFSLSAGAVRDSSDLHDAARDEQARFERIRVRYLPWVWNSSGGRCDERVGRMCVRLDDDGPTDWDPPPEDQPVAEARQTLLSALEEAGQAIPGDGWILGQRVLYSGRSGDWELAVRLARDCGLAPEDRWWCFALEGTSLHNLSQYREAGDAFYRMLAEMPDDTRAEWLALDRVVESGLRGPLEDASPDSLAILRNRLWTLGDPLFLVPGRDRETEHFVRQTLAHARADARNPYGIRWGDDLAEILVRYGPEVAYARERDSRPRAGPTPVIGRFHPASARFLPLEDHLQSPTGIALGAWRTDDTWARSRYVPPYAPLIGRLDVQQARFRRADSLLVVLGWKAEEPRPGEAFRGEGGAISGGLFLLSDPGLEMEDSTGRVEIRPPDLGADGSGPLGTAWARVPEGAYLLSLEVLDSDSHRAWRARHGVTQDPLPRGVIALSDLLFLDPRDDDAVGLPTRTESTDALERHLGRALPGTRIAPGPVEVAWEVYGLSGEEDAVAFQLTAVPQEGGFLRRAGEFLRLVDPESPVQIDWTEAVDPGKGTAPAPPMLRRLVIDLSALPPGPTRLSVSLLLPGRTPSVSEALIEVSPVGEASGP